VYENYPLIGQFFIGMHFLALIALRITGRKDFGDLEITVLPLIFVDCDELAVLAYLDLDLGAIFFPTSAS
jgi:hypothetical protein